MAVSSSVYRIEKCENPRLILSRRIVVAAGATTPKLGRAHGRGVILEDPELLSELPCMQINEAMAFHSALVFLAVAIIDGRLGYVTVSFAASCISTVLHFSRRLRCEKVALRAMEDKRFIQHRHCFRDVRR